MWERQWKACLGWDAWRNLKDERRGVGHRRKDIKGSCVSVMGEWLHTHGLILLPLKSVGIMPLIQEAVRSGLKDQKILSDRPCSRGVLWVWTPQSYSLLCHWISVPLWVRHFTSWGSFPSVTRALYLLHLGLCLVIEGLGSLSVTLIQILSAGLTYFWSAFYVCQCPHYCNFSMPHNLLMYSSSWQPFEVGDYYPPFTEGDRATESLWLTHVITVSGRKGTWTPISGVQLVPEPLDQIIMCITSCHNKYKCENTTSKCLACWTNISLRKGNTIWSDTCQVCSWSQWFLSTCCITWFSFSFRRNSSTKDLTLFAAEAIALNRQLSQHENELNEEQETIAQAMCSMKLSPPSKSRLAKRRAMTQATKNDDFQPVAHAALWPPDPTVGSNECAQF